MQPTNPEEAEPPDCELLFHSEARGCLETQERAILAPGGVGGEACGGTQGISANVSGHGAAVTCHLGRLCRTLWALLRPWCQCWNCLEPNRQTDRSRSFPL